MWKILKNRKAQKNKLDFFELTKRAVSLTGQFKGRSYKELKAWIDLCEKDCPDLKEFPIWIKAIYEEIRRRNADALADVPETPKPDSLGIRASIPLETILAAIEALELGVEFGRDALSAHDGALGRTIRRNRVAAEMMEAEIEQMLQTQKTLRGISEDSRHI